MRNQALSICDGTTIASLSSVTHVRSPRGYSLIEVAVATAITAIVSAIAAPNFVTLSARYQLTSAAHQVGFDVARARMKAIGENVYCRVVFATDESGHRYWLERSENGTTYTVDGAVTRLPSRVSLSSLPSTIPTYNRLGLGTGTAVINLVNTSGETKTVRINRLGKVAIE